MYKIFQVCPCVPKRYSALIFHRWEAWTHVLKKQVHKNVVERKYFMSMEEKMWLKWVVPNKWQKITCCLFKRTLSAITLHKDKGFYATENSNE